MLNKLTKKKEFEKVYKNGKSSFNQLLGIKTIQSQNKKARFGIIVSTKISKKAVERNKIKRQIRAALEKEQEKIKENIDCVIITRPEIINKNYKEIENSIYKNLKRLNLYK
ncbi:ribonuclease P protein component [Candidatus Falkowbacteria bacterium]|nr:MAG: ribonuclease P protein component [Candidatus Falkowbacteria bacterium]